MKLAILTLIALVGCTADPSSTAVAWDLGVRPVAAAGSSPEWAARVDLARDEWVALLGDCVAFDGASTQPIELVTHDEMIADTGIATDIGYTTHERILVEGTDADLAQYPTFGHRVLMHEMGHALGLGHVTPAADPSSVMHSIDDRNEDPDDLDIANARAAIGCAP